MSIRNEYLVSYDIECNKKRTKLFKILEGYGLFSIQKSVFWGFLTRAEIGAIIRYVEKNISPKTDKFFVTPIVINYNAKNTSFIGYHKNDFQDWKEYGSI